MVDTVVLLMAYGTPAKSEEVGPYLKDVFGGRDVPEHIVKETVRKYNAIGFSPLKEITNRQAELLEARLRNGGLDCKVTIGMKHWHPKIEEAILQIRELGPKNIIGMVAHPFRSLAGSEEYKHRFILASHGLNSIFIDDWYLQKPLHSLWGKNIEEAMSELGRDETFVIFTSHGLPNSIKDDVYKKQLLDFAADIAIENGIEQCCLAYQNGEHKDWYEPEVMEKLKELTATGIKKVLIVPIGYLSDSLETLYDIDVMYKAEADKMGLKLYRVKCPNTSQELIEAMAGAVESSV